MTSHTPRPLARLTACLALVLLASAASAQSDGELRRVLLTDGTVLVGTVDDESADPLVVRTRSGIEQRVPQAQVARIEPLAGGRFTRVDPTRTRTIVSPTGRTLGAGRSRVGTLVYVVPSASTAVTDNVDVSGTALFAFGDGGFVVPILGAKVGLVDTGTFAAAIGTTVALPTGGGASALALTPYAAATVGTELTSASIGVTGFLGGELGGGDFEAADGVLIQLGAESQLTNGFKVLGEVLLPAFDGGTEFGVFLPGVRFFGDRFSVDVYGIVGSDGNEVVGFAPLANFTYTF